MEKATTGTQVLNHVCLAVDLIHTGIQALNHAAATQAQNLAELERDVKAVLGVTTDDTAITMMARTILHVQIGNNHAHQAHQFVHPAIHTV